MRHAKGKKMNLTEQQHRFFETFGYLGFPGLFADEIDAISGHLTATGAGRVKLIGECASVPSPSRY